MKLSIIIPFVNELAEVKSTLNSYKRAFPDAELIVVQNNSSIPTPDLSDVAEDITITNIGICEGKGKAIIEGIKIAQHDIVGFTDADGSLSAEEFKKLVEVYEKFPCSLVMGNRRMKGAHCYNTTFIRSFSSLMYNTLVRILFQTGINDHQCGIKVLDKKCFNELKEFRFKDFSFDTELVIKLLKHNHRIIPHPIICYDSDKSKSNVKLFKHSIKMFLNLIRLKMTALGRSKL